MVGDRAAEGRIDWMPTSLDGNASFSQSILQCIARHHAPYLNPPAAPFFFDINIHRDRAAVTLAPLNGTPEAPDLKQVCLPEIGYRVVRAAPAQGHCGCEL